MAPYQYEPLGSPTTQIRLLELLPGRGILQCKLKVTDLDEARRTYEPISYCWKTYTREHWWGSTYKEKKKQKTIRVLVDGLDLLITESLHAALRRMRFKPICRVLWADAICINQADDSEKSAQVSIMGKIYQNGLRTLVWLGDADCWTRTAFSQLKRAADRDSNELEDFSKDSDSESDKATRHTTPRSLRLIWEICKTSHLFLALRSIDSRPYFERAWIVQEVVMSESVLVMCGKHRITGEQLYDGLYYYPGFHTDRTELILYGFVDLRENQGLYCLDQIIGKLSHMKASDPRDKVYSALALHQNCEDCEPITVSYSKDVDEVFLDATRLLLLRSPNLDLLSLSYGTTLPDGKDVPSWVWNPEAGSTRFHFSWDAHAVNASQGTEFRVRFQGRMLGLNGYAFDNVKKVGDVLSLNPDFLSHDSTIEAMKCYLSWVDVSGLNKQGITEVGAKARALAFRRALKPLSGNFAYSMEDEADAEDEADGEDFDLFHAEMMKRFGESLYPGKKTKGWSRLGLWANIEAVRFISFTTPAWLRFLS
ncbi:hypothetical protein DHEL01_v207771 [Diaporthe helianthi]|uniref:Heterokaryon incompatibility domain-containing protein n=1 Tax=Diaporthe helianthi TaxID=158607 RepID=A0A2P5HUB8_DIAHE|nr:hypothetical protein DHEL01_v207771 [Diaporthe helianthi]